jgi:hypothetical protein
MSQNFVGEFQVGDVVQGHDPMYWPEHKNKPLVVLYMDDDIGYGVGLPGNSADKAHSIKEGWVWYYPEEITAY